MLEEVMHLVLIVGYCEPGSLGGMLMNGAKTVRIFGEEYNVNAQVGVMRSMSAHGDYNDLLQFTKCQQADVVKKVFIVHGEYDVQVDFREKLLQEGFKNVFIPALHEEISLE